MDAYARLAPVAVELLDRVDAVLARAGAPADHPVWPLLRRVGALPGEAVAALAAVPDGAPAGAGALAAAGATVSGLAGGYGRLRATLPAAPDWHGPAADSFAVQWDALRGYLDGDLAGALRRTASYVDEVDAWVSGTRAALARTLATVLTSAEAVDLVTRSGPVAAADIAARVLAVLADAYERGERLRDAWAPRLAEVPYRAPATGGPARSGASTQVPL